MAKLILITGGSRSGKSSFALNLAEEISPRRLFVATCPSVDEEMSDRVRRHKEERKGRGWTTLETQLELGPLFLESAVDYDVILIDCITLWVNNILYDSANSGTNIDDFQINKVCNEWLRLTENFRGTVICVTNEVGLGIVPENALARKYRDLVGTCNQIIGKKADKVILVSCGIPLYLKNN